MIPRVSRSSSGAMAAIPRPGVSSSRMKLCSSVVTVTGSSPQRSHQVLAQHLAERAAGDLLAELDDARRLVVGQPLAAEPHELARGARAVGHHDSLDQFLALNRALRAEH